MDEEEAGKILETLRQGREKLRALKEEREKLLEANRKLVELVEELESVMEYVEGSLDDEQFSIGGHVYDYGRGWTPKDVVVEQALEIDADVDADEVEVQLDQIRDLIREVESYKNQQEGD